MNSKEFDVLVVGELNVDLILNKIDSFPVIGKEVISNDMTMTLGSSSAIFANNLSVLGSKVTFCGKTGADTFAGLVTSSLQAGGVDLSNIIRTKDFLTGVTVAMNFGNDRAMVTYPGAMNDLRINDISDQALMSASHMHLSSVFLQEGLKPGITELFKKAKAFGLTTSFDPQWDPHEKWDIDLESLLPFVDVFLPNAEEVKNLSGEPTIEKALLKIRPFCNIVIVKDGVNGSVMRDKKQSLKQKAFLNEHVIDAIGAGDSFNSGFIYKYVNGKSLEECLEFAALTGAVNTTSAGGTSAFKSMADVRRIAKEKFNYNVTG